MDAISGEDSDQFGSRVFDLSENGCNLRIRIDDQGGFPTYVASKFIMPSALPGVDPEAIYSETSDLTTVFNIKGYDELQSALDEHFHVKDTTTQVESTPVVAPVAAATPAPAAVAPAAQPVAEQSTSAESDDVSLDEDKIKQLLQGLDG